MQPDLQFDSDSTRARCASTAAWSALLASMIMLPALAQGSAVEIAELVPSFTGTPGARFGASSALSDDGRTLVVASPWRLHPNGDHDGRVHVFVRPAPGLDWELDETLFPDGGTTTEIFGESVAIDGDFIAVGSGGATTFDDGAAYVFRRVNSSWFQEARITEPPNVASGGDLGRAVAIEGTTLVASDPRAFGNGRVYVYTRIGGNWVRQATLAPGAATSGSFGIALALDGERLAIGLLRRNMGAGGEARIYRRTGGLWNLEDTVQPDSVPYGQYVNDDFGMSLDLVGSTLLVGAPSDQVPGNQATSGRGAAFVFRRSGSVWSEYSRIVPLTVVPHSRFGGAVDLASESHAVVGAPGNDVAASSVVSEGAVHHFELVGGLWLQRELLLASDGQGDDFFGTDVDAYFAGSSRTIVAGSYNGGTLSQGASYSFEANGATWAERQRLVEPSLSFANHGSSIAFDGNLAVVGAPVEDEPFGDSVGAVYVYERNLADWALLARIAPSTRAAGDRFGARVAVSGNYVAVSAPYDDHAGGTDAGAVFVFERVGNGFPLRATLMPNDPGALDQFGTSLALRGSTLAVGSPGDDNAGGVNAGAAYIFTRSGALWSQAAKLASTDLAAGDLFGSAVAVVAASRIVVGAEGANAAAVDSGAAYVFDRTLIIGGNFWSQRTRLAPAGLAVGDRLGASVASSGNFIALGAPFADVSPFVNGGRAYLYEFSGTVGSPGNTFTLRATLSDPSGATNANFGSELALDAATFVVGINASNMGGPIAGKVLVHQRLPNGIWTGTQTVLASAPEEGDRLGRGVAVSGGVLIAGAIGRTNMAGDGAGSALVFDLWHGGGFGVNYCTAVANSSGGVAAMAVLGSPVSAANNLRLRASNMPPASTGYFLVSPTSGFVAMPGGARGNLCLGGTIGRFAAPGQILSTGTTGSFELQVDLGNIPTPGASSQVHAGDTWHFQAWFRDVGVPGFSSNLSDGIAVTFH